MSGEIVTPRLRLVPFTLPLIQAFLRDRRELERALGVEIPGSWPEPDYAEILPAEAERLARFPESARWGRLIVHRDDRRVIGEIGVKGGGPDGSGAVEIGYSIVPEYRDRGYATEAARAFVDWLFRGPGVRRVTAECLVDNAASIRVLEKVGFRRTGGQDDLLFWSLGPEDWPWPAGDQPSSSRAAGGR